MLNRVAIRPVTVLGAGSIGSWVAYALAKAGVPKITVYDDDVVEPHNTPMSLYSDYDIGRLKVDALRERIDNETKTEIVTHAEKFGDQPLARGSLIVCVDRMDENGFGRIPIWNRVKAAKARIDLMVDTRIDKWFGEIYAIVPTLADDVAQYEQTLLPDSEMGMQVCGFHGIGSMSMAVAGDAANTLFRYWNTGNHTWRHPRQYDTLR